MVRDVLRDLPFAEIDPRAMITMVRDTLATTLFLLTSLVLWFAMSRD